MSANVLLEASAEVEQRFYQDTDADGYGNLNSYITAVSAPAGYVSDSSDCNDNNSSIHPNATEIQNSIDDNCNGQVDEGLIGFNQFVFLKGNTTDYRYGSYGIQGVASVSNNPGIRRYQNTWSYNGKIYMYGGEGVASQLSSPGGNPPPPQGYLSDIWEYDPATNNWRWLKSVSSLGGAPVYGTKGVAAATNNPGARKNAMIWILNNKFYLFGGYNGSRLCDLWEYNPATNNWTWIAGTNAANSAGVYGTLNISDANNLPPGREQGATWIYNGKLYLFGGLRSNGVNDVHMNDLWEYDFSTGWWTWIKGTNLTNQYGVYGSQGVASSSNLPGSRYESGFATLGNKVYVYGGIGFGAANGGILSDLWEYDNLSGNWTWLKGSTANDELKIPGTLGTYNSANTPGARNGTNITVQNNTLYLYGGFNQFFGGSFQSDLWQYDPSINQWRWVKGSSGVGTIGDYGLQNTEANSNVPGGRGQGSFITIGSHLYLFGGRGYRGVGTASDESQNDLWKFNTANNNWTWLNGPSGKERYGEYGTTGIASATNKPGDRVGHSMAALNNKVYMFGGNAKRTYNEESNSNDLWEYDPAANKWKFLKGSSTFELPENYGSLGIANANNLPGSRSWSVMWAFNNKVYMFGGIRGGYKNDLWVYDPVSNNWTWLKGSSGFNQPGVYGTKGIAASGNTPGARLQPSACIYNNKLYLFGGEGYNSGATTGDLNDLWEYDPATNNWTWIAGDDAINVAGVYGTLGVPNASNKPGSRVNANAEIINNKLYLFGNLGHGNTVGRKLLNDLWQYDFAAGMWTFIKGSNTGAATGSTGSQGIEASTNMPGTRTGASGFTIGNKLYIFGGTPFSNSYNDLWEYNPATNNWRWLKGPGNISNQRGNYGLTAIAALTNVPPARKQMMTAVIGNTAYLFGGEGQYATNIGENFNITSDLWKWEGTPLGVNHKLYVNNNDNSLTGDVYTTAIGNNNNPGTPSAPLATIDYAITYAQPGDTIFVDAGVYSSNINITLNKSVTLLGINYQISPNDPVNPLQANFPARFHETIIENHTFIIGANDIRIKGFFFEPNNKTQIQQTVTTNDFDNIEIEKNIFSNISGFQSINITGRQAMPLATVNYLITGNRFEKTFVTGGTTITLNAIDQAVITNNTFTIILPFASPRIQAGMTIGQTYRMDNVTISNNNAYQYSTFIASGNTKRLTITGNKTLENDRFMGLSIFITDPSETTVSDNIITNDKTFATSFSYVRTNGTDLSAPNIFRAERNTITIDGTGLAFTPQALIAPTITNSPNSELNIVENKLKYTGDYSSMATGTHFKAAIRLWQSPKNSIVARNEITFDGTNYGNSPADILTGILLYHSTLPAGASFDFANNKVSGFTHSIAVAENPTNIYGKLPAGVTVNINNNSLIGAIVAINNGTTGQTVNATCNWYGVAASQNVITKITPSTVNYIPWLTSGTDNDIPTVGFQPVPGVCNGTPVVITLNNAANITCNGANNGSINITASGGVPAYTYAWTMDENPGFSSTNDDISNLAPGNYNVSVTDANGSISTLEVNINEPDLLTALADGSNNICFGASEGSASVIVQGGTTPYSYLWSNGETTEDIFDLIAGTYTVTVTDANGCTASASYEVTQPAQLTAVAAGTSTSCANSATVVANGGTGGYTYLWSNGATTQTITSLPAGTYTVIVTDANGCETTASCTVTANEAFNPSASVVDVSCYSGSNGSITINNVNGVAPFQYSIDGSNYQNGNVFNGLTAGTYTITVVDANGCTGFVTKTITQPSLLIAVLNTVQSTCYGISTGSITVIVSGGTTAYSYQWTGPNGYTSSQKNINNLATGNYSFTVTDNNGCTANFNVVVPNFNEINVSPLVTNIACKGQTSGSINLTVSGGTGNGFTYSWSNGASTEDIVNLGVGNYNVTITDIGSGCMVTRNFSITQPANVVGLSTSKTNATGCNSLGTITATGSGGTGPYQYKLDNGAYQSSGLFAGLYGGSYTAWVKDAKGCTKSAGVSITDNGSDEYESNNSKAQAKVVGMGTTISARIALATDAADWFKFTTTAAGNYILSVSHPAVTYTFNMYTTGNNTPALTPLITTSTSKKYLLNGSTTYYISVTGATSYSCYQLQVAPDVAARLAQDPVVIENNPVKEFTSPVKKLQVSVFPNPHHGAFRLQVTSPEAGWADVELYNGNGQKIIVRRHMMKTGENTIRFNNIKESLLLYKISIGKNSVAGKIIGPN